MRNDSLPAIRKQISTQRLEGILRNANFRMQVLLGTGPFAGTAKIQSEVTSICRCAPSEKRLRPHAWARVGRNKKPDIFRRHFLTAEDAVFAQVGRNPSPRNFLQNELSVSYSDHR